MVSVYGSDVDTDCPMSVNNVMLGLNPVEPSYSGPSSLTRIDDSLSFATPMSHMVTSYKGLLNSSAIVN